MRVILLVTYLMGLSGPAWAGQVYFTGNALHKFCRAETASYDGAVCTGYVAGMADAIVANSNELIGQRSCKPNGVALGQVVDIVKLWLEKRPQYRHLSSPGIIAWALSEAFPCK